MNPSGILDVAHSIQLSVAPVFLLSAVGVVLTVLTNRMTRIIDRARSLEDVLRNRPQEAHPEAPAEIQRLSKRARTVQLAITLATVCALLICLVIVSLFAAVALTRDLSQLTVILFVAALGAFIGSLLAFLMEIRAATASLRFGPGPH